MPHPELAAEQAYVDNAYEQLERMRATLAGAQDRMATEFAAVRSESPGHAHQARLETPHHPSSSPHRTSSASHQVNTARSSSHVRHAHAQVVAKEYHAGHPHANLAAARRHHNVEWAKSAVRESASISAEKALELKVIDLIAVDFTDLLKQLKVRNDSVALLLADQRMPRMDGVVFLQEAMHIFPDAKRALLTAYADTNAAISAIN